MARPLRLEFPGAVYHVTSRGNARQNIVQDNCDRSQFLTLLAHVLDRYGWLCHAYCLMDNHYHLLIETPKPNLSLGMRQLNGRYTQIYNRRHTRVGHLFQGRFTAILVEKEVHLLELCRYVVLNPVGAKLVPHPRDWAWSSYQATVGEMKSPDWLTTDWILGQFGVRAGPARERYRTFVTERHDKLRPWDQLTGQIYMGSTDFVAKHQPNRVIRDIPRRQTQAHRPSLHELFRQKEKTAQLIHTAYRQYGYRLAEIADHLGVHAVTVSRRLKKAEKANV